MTLPPPTAAEPGHRSRLALVSLNDDRLRAFEREICRALRDSTENSIEILGYGEVTTVLAIDDAVCCKRIPAFPELEAAEHCASVIRRYISELGKCGVDVVETEVRLVRSDDSTFALYCLQPRLDPAGFGPARMRGCEPAQALELFDRILAVLKRAVLPRLAPDGQLSNWAFVDGRLIYLDVSSPFLRDEAGNDVLDWSQYMRSLPAPLRPLVRRWVLPQLLDKYFTLRGQVVDLLGNLKKERLEHLIVPFREHANQRLAIVPPVTAAEVSAYYKQDARTYAAIQALRRVDRWVQRGLLGRAYPYFLPPRLDRNV